MSLRFASELPARKHSHTPAEEAYQEMQPELSVYLFPSAPASSTGLQLEQPILRPRLESATSNGSAWTLPESLQTPQEGDISSLCSFTDDEEFFDAVSSDVGNRRPLQIWTAPLPPNLHLPMNSIRMRLHDPSTQSPLRILSDESLSDISGSVTEATPQEGGSDQFQTIPQGWVADFIEKWFGIDRNTIALVYPPATPGQPPVDVDNGSILLACTQRLGRLLRFESRESHGGQLHKGLQALGDIDL